MCFERQSIERRSLGHCTTRSWRASIVTTASWTTTESCWRWIGVFLFRLFSDKFFWKSVYREDYVSREDEGIHRICDLESDGFLLSLRLGQFFFCSHWFYIVISRVILAKADWKTRMKFGKTDWAIRYACKQSTRDEVWQNHCLAPFYLCVRP